MIQTVHLPKAPPAPPLRLRVRIGITGHRELSDPDAVVASANAVLGRLRDDFGALLGSDVVYTVVSSLAEGADRLLASAALDEFGPDGVTLESILPMAASEYAGDFDSAASQDAFAELLASADRVTVVSETEDRDHAYELAGRHVVDTCDILIAAWDGEQARGRGGTGEIVSYARRHGVPVCVAWPGEPPAGLEADPGGAARVASLREAAKRFAEYNEVDLRSSGGVSAVLNAERDRYAEAVGDTELHWQCELVGDWAFPHVVRADELALSYQRRYNRLGETLFGAAALAVTAVTLQYVINSDGVIGTWIEVALMLLLLVGFAFGRRARVHDRWLGYRSLAEALRGAQYIALTGVRDPDLADVGLDAGPSRTAWFQRAFSEVWRERPQLDYKEAEAPELGRVLADAWITPQIEYHRRAVQRFALGHRRLTWAVFVLFAVTFLIAIIHGRHIVEDDPFPRIFFFLAVTLPSFGAALTGVRDQRQFRLHEDRSRRTADRLLQLRRRMAAETSLPAVQRLAAEVQGVMTEENLDWSGVVEFQDLEMIL